MSYIGTTEYDLEVARGNVGDVTGNSIFGCNNDLDTADNWILIWGAGVAWAPIASAVALDISSDDVNDTLLGTGARKITVIGLDAAGAVQSMEYDMSGTTIVITAETWTAVNQAFISDAGSGEMNAGSIIIDETTTTDRRGFIGPDESRTQQMQWKVPAGHSAYIEAVLFAVTKNSGGSNPIVDIRAFKIEGTVRTKLFDDTIDAAQLPAIGVKLKNKLKIPAGATWYVEANTDTNNTVIRGHVEQKIIKD